MAEIKETNPQVTISNAPHIRVNDSVIKIMWTVVIAMLPAAAYSVYIFGIPALIIYAVAIGAALASEALFQILMKRPVTVHDGSAVITGMLIAMNVPPAAPPWVVAIGSFFAMIIVKQLFGGLGFNIFNPALAARAFMLASWPVYMTTGWHSFGGTRVLSSTVENSVGLPQKAFDALSQATPMWVTTEGPKLVKEYGITLEQLYDFVASPEMIKAAFIGNVGGCIGETSAALLLLGGIILLVRGVITWHIPVSFIGAVALLSFLYYSVIGYPAVHMVTLSHVLSGGLFLGAFFMATDMVTSPVTGKGMILFGAGAGAITFVIRIWGGYPEGVSYSILLMNAVVPLIDRFIKPKVFGKN